MFNLRILYEIVNSEKTKFFYIDIHDFLVKAVSKYYSKDHLDVNILIWLVRIFLTANID